MSVGEFAATTTWSGAGLRASLANPAVRFNYPREGFAISSDNVVVLKDAPEIVIPAESKAKAEMQRLCPLAAQELYTKIWTGLNK